jgi:glucose/arabinose dehydrogenase
MMRLRLGHGRPWSGPLAALLTLLTLGLAAAPAPALELPDGFDETTLVAGLERPVAVAFASDGRMFVAEDAGRVRAVTAAGTLVPTPVIDISAHVNNRGDRGLLGIAVDKDFATNG